MNKKLYLASKSQGRQWLLNECGIPFELVKQEADEYSCDWGMPLQKLTESLAQLKMEHVILPDGQDGQQIVVLTADTLGIDKQGNIHGKPRDKTDAIRMLQEFRKGAITGSGFCLERKLYEDGQWVTQEQYVGYGQAEYIFDVPDKFLDDYFKKLEELTGFNYLKLSGGFSISGYGMQFLKMLHGSYTSVIGLPMYKLHQSLDAIGFFD